MDDFEDDLQIDLGFDDEPDAANDAQLLTDVVPSPPPQVKNESKSDQHVVAGADNVQHEQSGKHVDSTDAGQSKALVETNSRKDGVGCVVYVTNMSWWTSDVQLEGACAKYGTIKSMKFFEDRSNGRSAGTCTVEFNSSDEARACLEGLPGTKVGDDEVQCHWPGKRAMFKLRPPGVGDPDGMGPGPGRGAGRGFRDSRMGPPMGMMRPMRPMGGLGPHMGPMVPMGPMMGHMGPMMGPPMGPMTSMGPMGSGHMLGMEGTTRKRPR